MLWLFPSMFCALTTGPSTAKVEIIRKFGVLLYISVQIHHILCYFVQPSTLVTSKANFFRALFKCRMMAHPVFSSKMTAGLL